MNRPKAPDMNFILVVNGAGTDGWGWTDRRREEEARNLWKCEKLPGGVSVPRIGTGISL